MTLTEAKTLLSSRLNIDYSDIANNKLVTDSDLTTELDLANKRAWNYRAWSIKEHTYTTTATSDGYYDYPADYEDESISRLTINDVEFTKTTFDDYTKYLQENPTGKDKVWAEHKRFYFVNTNAVSVGDTIAVTGILRSPTLTTGTDLLMFSPTSDNQENSGNQAIVLIALAQLLGSNKYRNESGAAIEEKRAFTMLDILWEPIAKRRAKEQSKDRPMWNVPDFFARSGTSKTSF